MYIRKEKRRESLATTTSIVYSISYYYINVPFYVQGVSVTVDLIYPSMAARKAKKSTKDYGERRFNIFINICRSVCASTDANLGQQQQACQQ